MSTRMLERLREQAPAAYVDQYVDQYIEETGSGEPVLALETSSTASSKMR